MRIIAGIAKGRILKAPPGSGTRPMTGRAREAVFSSIAAALPGADVLDLYAGTGSLGLEALSRGAATAVFVERDRAALRALRANVGALGLGGEVVARSVDGYLASATADHPSGPSVRFTLVFVDPPYELPITGVEQQLAAAARLLGHRGSLVLHRRLGEHRPEAPGLRLVRTRTYGTARIWRYEKIRPGSG
ncbi:MAG: 16S rRNA (guanine(966)-N(2))-methyltransferase RsmD [Acidimicrobiia bacterium]|nr:16S rRNA (guanine(966)-N(2))-methyltransferase RsmD [Acidimicrobiia bacterium]MYC85574.1 16S rRNA (guanine(966)-N(2))-methyltransferase RsmD [Acidimicrobiia bacterium]